MIRNEGISRFDSVLIQLLSAVTFSKHSISIMNNWLWSFRGVTRIPIIFFGFIRVVRTAVSVQFAERSLFRRLELTYASALNRSRG